MTHTIIQSQHRITTPTGLYEANYRRIIRLVPILRELGVNDDFYLYWSKITINVLEQYKYTTVISLRQSLKTSSTHGLEQDQQSAHLMAIDMELRVCHDARLLEVIGYQGKSPIQSASIYPNRHMLQIDEKRQLNIFLKDVLENSLKSEVHHTNKTSL